MPSEPSSVFAAGYLARDAAVPNLARRQHVTLGWLMLEHDARKTILLPDLRRLQVSRALRQRLDVCRVYIDSHRSLDQL